MSCESKAVRSSDEAHGRKRGRSQPLAALSRAAAAGSDSSMASTWRTSPSFQQQGDVSAAALLPDEHTVMSRLELSSTDMFGADHVPMAAAAAFAGGRVLLAMLSRRVDSLHWSFAPEWIRQPENPGLRSRRPLFAHRPLRTLPPRATQLYSTSADRYGLLRQVLALQARRSSSRLPPPATLPPLPCATCRRRTCCCAASIGHAPHAPLLQFLATPAAAAGHPQQLWPVSFNQCL